MSSSVTGLSRNRGEDRDMARSRAWNGVRFALCAIALAALTVCEFMQFFGGEGAYATAVERPAPAPAEPTTDDIVAIQRALADLGYGPGPADGEVGAWTTSAIERYQNQAGLPVDGQVSLALLESLRENPVPAPEPVRAAPTAVAEQAEPEEPPVQDESDVVVIPIPRDLPDNTLPPVYETGDVFAWSDGSVDTVYRVSGDRVFWRTSRGASFNMDPNFLVPPSSWDGASGMGSATMDIGRNALWPLRPGDEISFSVTSASSAHGDMVASWRCAADGEKKVVVPAGVFDTQVFSCTRDGAQPGGWVARTWYYAPTVRHYVRRIDGFEDGTRRVMSLVAMRPSGQGWPSAARIGFDWAIQDALETQINGVAVDWGSTGVREKFRIMPTKNHDTTGGYQCRSFILMSGASSTQRTYPAIACRDKEEKRWLVPVLDEAAPSVGQLQGTS
jgi:hypothetical protein